MGTTATSAFGTGSSFGRGTTGCSPFSSTAGQGKSAFGFGISGDGGTSFGNSIKDSGTIASNTFGKLTILNPNPSVTSSSSSATSGGFDRFDAFRSAINLSENVGSTVQVAPNTNSSSF